MTTRCFCSLSSFAECGYGHTIRRRSCPTDKCRSTNSGLLWNVKISSVESAATARGYRKAGRVRVGTCCGFARILFELLRCSVGYRWKLVRCRQSCFKMRNWRLVSNGDVRVGTLLLYQRIVLLCLCKITMTMITVTDVASIWHGELPSPRLVAPTFRTFPDATSKARARIVNQKRSGDGEYHLPRRSSPVIIYFHSNTYVRTFWLCYVLRDIRPRNESIEARWRTQRRLG